MATRKKSFVTLLALITGCAAQYGQGGAYEAELRRRQVEYAQQQALRQQQAQVRSLRERAPAQTFAC